MSTYWIGNVELEEISPDFMVTFLGIFLTLACVSSLEMLN